MSVDTSEMTPEELCEVHCPHGATLCAALDRLAAENVRLREAAYRALNYIENTETELSITLGCGDALRAALAQGVANPAVIPARGGDEHGHRAGGSLRPRIEEPHGRTSAFAHAARQKAGEGADRRDPDQGRQWLLPGLGAQAHASILRDDGGPAGRRAHQARDCLTKS